MSPEVLDTIRPELEVMCLVFFQTTRDVFIVTKCNIDVEAFVNYKMYDRVLCRGSFVNLLVEGNLVQVFNCMDVCRGWRSFTSNAQVCQLLRKSAIGDNWILAGF